MDEQRNNSEPVRVYTENDSLLDILRAIKAKQEALESEENAKAEGI